MTILKEFSQVQPSERSQAIKDAFENLPDSDKKEVKRASRQLVKKIPDVGDNYALEILASIGALMVKLGDEDSGG